MFEIIALVMGTLFAGGIILVIALEATRERSK